MHYIILSGSVSATKTSHKQISAKMWRGGALLKVVPKQTTVLIIFSYPCNGSESIVFGSNFRNGDFDGLTRYEDP